MSVLVSDGDGDSVVAFYVPTLRPVSSGREVEVGSVEIIIDGRDLWGPSFFKVTISAIKG